MLLFLSSILDHVALHLWIICFDCYWLITLVGIVWMKSGSCLGELNFSPLPCWCMTWVLLFYICYAIIILSLGLVFVFCICAFVLCFEIPLPDNTPRELEQKLSVYISPRNNIENSTNLAQEFTSSFPFPYFSYALVDIKLDEFPLPIHLTYSQLLRISVWHDLLCTKWPTMGWWFQQLLSHPLTQKTGRMKTQ